MKNRLPDAKPKYWQ